MCFRVAHGRATAACSHKTEHGREGKLFHVSGSSTPLKCSRPMTSSLHRLPLRGQMILVDPISKLNMVHTAVRQKASDRAANAATIALVARGGRPDGPMILKRQH